MSKLSLTEMEESDAKADIWREEEHDSVEYISLIQMAKNALNRSTKTLSD
jgi:hypothetical protein